MAKRAKRTTPRRAAKRRAKPGATTARQSAKRPIRKSASKAGAKGRAASKKRAALPRRAASKKAAASRSAPATGQARRPRLDRARRTLEETVPTPPSSLDMHPHGSAVRTGRKVLGDSIHEHTGMTPAITGGDVDADWENAYFSGDEAPGGDNPTPDQEVVDEIGRSLGVEYQDSEELKGSDKLTERDKHRWELDPASSEDYKERK